MQLCCHTCVLVSYSHVGTVLSNHTTPHVSTVLSNYARTSLPATTTEWTAVLAIGTAPAFPLGFICSLEDMLHGNQSGMMHLPHPAVTLFRCWLGGVQTS